jgi:signal transduction histidine kinase
LKNLQSEDVITDPPDTSPGREPRREQPRGRALQVQPGGLVAALVIGLLGVGVSLLLWQRMQENSAIELERRAQWFASALSSLVESRINGEYEVFHRRAELWLAFRGEQGATPWQREAETFLKEHPGFLAVVRVQPPAPNDIAASSEGQEVLQEVTPKPLDRVSKSNGTGFAAEIEVSPQKLADGRIVFGIEVPAATKSGPGLLFGVFQPTLALENLLEKRAPNYDISVKVGDMTLYERERGAAGILDAPRFGKSEAITLMLGEHWTLTVRPTSTVIEGASSGGPTIALVAGILISALLASLVPAIQLARARALALDVLNAELADKTSTGASDHAEIRKLNEALEARVKERTGALNDTIAELETFNYSVSHDLRSPLGAIINFAAILSEDYKEALDDAGKDYLRRIVNSATTAVSLMDALLAFSRSGRDDISKTRVVMRELVQEVYAELVAASPELRCAVKIGDLPDVHADPAMMRFIVINLLNNACKFVKPGEKPRVEVAGYSGEREVTYFVRDGGIGFDMRYADKLFKVFERLHPGEDYAGHGVGLAIVARMVRRHGGRVWAQGATGKGATFYFSLPDLMMSTVKSGEDAGPES